jgi:amino acid adenylation domain-containing protein
MNVEAQTMSTNQTVQIVDTYPLSPIQQGMLFHWVTEPHFGVDIEQVVCSLPEALHVDKFRMAWERMVARHAVFRTSFRWERLVEPLQDVHGKVTLPFVERDWSALSSADQKSEMAAYLAKDRKLGFDLSQAPNLRVMVARVGEGQYQFVWTFHHILLDGRSFPAVLKEVFTIYEALVAGNESVLPAPVPFRLFIDWHQKQDWSKSEAFWRKKLKGFSVPTSLRTIRPPEQTRAEECPRREQEAQVPESRTSSLKQIATDGGVTLGTLVQGAWALLLSRYSGEEDIVFGVIRACRRASIPDAEAVVGIFINTIPLRVSVPPGTTLLPWLKELRGQESELRQHEHTPLFKIQQWSEVQGRKSLFDSLLMFDHQQLNTVLNRDKTGHNRRFDLKESVNFPLVLQAYGEDQLALKLQYCRALFDDATISRMLGHLQTLLRSMVGGAELRLSALSLVSEPERQQIVFDWNNGRNDYPSHQCLHAIFEKEVVRVPDSVALTCDGQSLTYRQLNARANCLARQLRTLGVGPDVLVGICMERSNDLVVGLLAILKAGGAYLPIDLAYPAERLAFMLADSKAPVLLTQSTLKKDLPATAAKVICVDDWLRQRASAAAEEQNLSPVAGPDHLAYVIYTSGTTGKPKGSLITHRNVTRLFSATDHWYHFNDKDVWTLFHSYAFDFSVWEIWGALLYGGRVVVVPYVVSRSPEAFYQLLARERVTVLSQTPSAFRQLIQAEETVGQKDLGLRYVIFGGEALEMQSLRPWFERHGDQQPVLVNMYGITETTVHVTYRPLSQDDVKANSVIGVPIPDLQVYILDAERQPVPIGVPGEMYVGGAGLARGYLNRPDLTADRFIPDHLTGRSGSRLYRTGDLARFLPDRDIEYLGRIDHQVKIRGFRIELGEIESVLCEHSAVREAVVLAREDTLGDKRLVAYVVSSGPPPSVKKLREHLKTKTPEYMVPSAFVFMDKIPLTENGKVDRKSLPAPDQERPDLGSEVVAPRTEMEKAVCRIWTEVLGVERIGIHDDFFDLGGHSFITLRVVSMMAERLKCDIAPSIMFEHRTIASLCAVLEAGVHSQAEAVTVPGPQPAAKTERSRVDLSPVRSIAEKSAGRNGSFRPTTPYRMQESWLCKWILVPLYDHARRRSLRRLLESLILKLEGGEYFTVTLRKLYKKHHQIEVGDYTCGCFDVDRMRTSTRIGRFTSVSYTASIQNADHPRNTISTNAIFYQNGFGFAAGYKLARTQVQIGNDVFIGHNAMILYPTRRIGDGAVIAAGSFVVEDVPPYAIVGGYPAKVLRYRFSQETIEELQRSRWWIASLEELEPTKAHFAVPLEGDAIR